MGCFANFFKFIYCALAVLAILLLMLIMAVPAYHRYCADKECNVHFHMNPTKTLCIPNKRITCPPVYKTSFFHRLIWIQLCFIFPIILVCAVLNFLMALLCCPFGPKGVTSATGFCAFLVFSSLFWTLFSRGMHGKIGAHQYIGFYIMPGPTFYLLILEFILLVVMTVLSSFVSFLSKLCL